MTYYVEMEDGFTAGDTWIEFEGDDRSTAQAEYLRLLGIERAKPHSEIPSRVYLRERKEEPVPTRPAGYLTGNVSTAAMETVKVELDRLGYDHSGLTMRVQDGEMFPHWRYSNRKLIVTDGMQAEQYSADLIEGGAAWVTAGEIVSLFGLKVKP